MTVASRAAIGALIAWRLRNGARCVNQPCCKGTWKGRGKQNGEHWYTKEGFLERADWVSTLCESFLKEPQVPFGQVVSEPRSILRGDAPLGIWVFAATSQAAQ